MKKNLLLVAFLPFAVSAQSLFQMEVSTQNNDVEVRADNTADITSSDLELAGKDGATLQETFLRFEGISLPADAAINSVYLVFNGDEPSTSSTTMKITGEIGNSLPYPASAAASTGLNLKSRIYSTSFAEWITSGCVVDQQYQSPDLKNVLNEMFANAGLNNASLAFRIQGNGQGAFTVRSYSAAAGKRPKLVINYSTQTVTVTTVVSSGNNDAEQTLTNGNMDLAGGILELGGKSGLTPQVTGLRFENVQIPAGAEITKAYIEFYSYGTNPNNAELVFRTELGNAPVYTAANSNISGRNYSHRKAKWVTAPWTSGNTIYKSADLKEIIDENRLNGWQSGQALAFKVEGNDGSATAWSVNGWPNYQPKLVIEYKNNGAGPSVGPAPQDETIRKYVSAGENDGIQNLSTGGMDLVRGILELGGKSGATAQTTGVRFENIQLPDNAQVTDAYIEFYAYGNSANARVKISSEMSNAEVYNTTSGNITKRDYSSIFVDWNTGNWTSNSKYRTANLRNLVDQARINGWQSGNSLSFKLESDSGGANVYSRNGSELYQPRLVIEYLNNNGGPEIDIESNPANMSKLYINEVSSEGTQSQDEDWIEIYNDHDYPVYFNKQNSGIYLSDKNGNRTLSELKDIYIPAKGFTTFIADSDPSKGNNHLNFGLGSDGETVYFSRKVGGNVIQQDILTYQGIPYNQTVGKFPDGTGSLVNFITPTYNTSNNEGKQRVDLGFSKTRGVYDSGFDLTISAPAGTTVKYTLDGKTPSAIVGTVYTAPIAINKTSAVKVYAYDGGGNNSGVVAHTYVLRNNYANESTADGYWQWYYKSNITAAEYAQAIGEVPIVSVTTNSEPNTTWAEASVEYIDNNVYSGRKNFFSNSLARKFGQESVGFYNPNLKFKFNSDSGVKKANYTFFDDYPNDAFENPGKIQTLELKQGQDNASRNVYNIGFMRFSEKISMNLQKEIGKYALNTRYINLFINGKYRGLKTMRNDFNANNLEEVFGDDDNNYTKVNLQDGYFTGGVVESGDGSQAVWNNIRNTAAAKKFQDFKKLVDVDDLIKFQLVFMFTDTENEAAAITHNTNPDVMKAKFMINDTDGSFFGGITVSSSDVSMPARGFAGGGGNYKFKWLYSPGSINGPGGLFGNFMGSNTNATTGNLEFKTLVKDAVLKYIGPASGNFAGADGASLSVVNVQNKIQTTMTELDRLYKLDAAYMGYTGNVYEQWKNVDGPRIIAQVPERVSFNLKKWLEYNMAHTLLPNEIPTPATIRKTDTIQIDNPNSGTQVYYTLNDTDPMGNDGVVSQEAYLYNGTFTLPVGTYNIITRAFTTNNWGPKFSKMIKVEDVNPGKFVITGINYKPQTNGDAEFLMLTNAGGSDLDVSGYTVTDAVTYTFPQGTIISPNQTIMLVKDLALVTGFSQHNKFQWTSGSLSNSGEPITFKDKSGSTVDYVFFSGISPWPVEANGQGSYLKLISSDLNNELPASWEAKSISSDAASAKMAKPTGQRMRTDIDTVDNNRGIKIYPVPMKDILFVNLNEESVISIYNMTGQIVKTEKLDTGKNSIDVSGLSQGGYLIKIQGEKESKVFKVTKD
ncbi:lamin tail domain-containing protein [Chryseobacterium shigense]|uniref:LTD domain-containing protein n=1 Tax=Chryseobacterium shigense TaxID=297244 RepID=A0A841NDS7_9FLAO|nr:lamin tail domain-containing protein [Chryseobacterium shigense]MBB6371938.1 hypothetical protein [Chryseobacterium shigense]